MHSFVIQDPDFKPEAGIDTLIVEPEASIGIEEVRQVQSFLARKPLGEKNVVYIKQAHLLTIPAQNALLKTLEEPPGNSEIYLLTTQPDLLLPTVLSRVHIQDHTHHHEVDAKHLEIVEKVLTKVRESKVGERLALVDSLNFTREEALVFLDHLEHYMHHHLNERLNYDAVAQARQYLKANTNIKLALDNLFLQLTLQQQNNNS